MGRLDPYEVMDELTPELLRLWAAHSLLDGWGDEWKVLAREIYNGSLRAGAAFGGNVKRKDLVSAAEFEPFTANPERKRLTIKDGESQLAKRYG